MQESNSKTEISNPEAPDKKTKNRDKDKKNKRALKARRAIEDYLEDRHIESLSGKRYWDEIS